MEPMTQRYDDGIPELTPAEFAAREAARRASLTERFAGSRFDAVPQPRPLPVRIGDNDKPRPRAKNGARIPRLRGINGGTLGRPSKRVIDLESGRTFDDAFAAAADVGPGASVDSVRTMIRNRGPYKGRWFAWYTPTLGKARERARALRKLRKAREPVAIARNRRAA